MVYGPCIRHNANIIPISALFVTPYINQYVLGVIWLSAALLLLHPTVVLIFSLIQHRATKTYQPLPSNSALWHQLFFKISP